MPPATVYRLAQTRIADLYRQGRPDVPGRACRTRTPTPRHRNSGLRAVMARRMLTVLGGGSLWPAHRRPGRGAPVGGTRQISDQSGCAQP